MSKTKDQLLIRARNALDYMNSSKLIGINSFGTKISKFAGANMNSLWATIVLGEWLKELETHANGLD